MKKFLTFLALACFMVAGAWAQAYQLGSKVTDLASLSAEKLYAIHSTNNEGYWCYNSTINQNYVGITGVKTDGSGVVGNAAANTAYHATFQPGNVNNQWKITNEDGAYYLYNVGAGQYVTRTDRDYLFTTEKTALDAIHANANGSFAIHAGGGYSGGSTNFACIVTNSTPQAVRNWTSTDHGSMLEFFEIEEISQLQDDLNALIATVEEAYAANDEAIWGANLITANSQFSSNATEPNEGSTNNLLDGNLSTFWHSQWSGDYSSKLPHYLQVALNEPISGTVQMTMGRRQGAANDHPMKMSVQYSADGTSYTQADGYMEFSGNTGYVHGTFTLPTDAQYLRFYADETDKNRGYWHCSEFQLKSLFKQAANDQHPTEAAALQNALATAKAVTSATQADIDNLQAALNTYKAAVDPVKTNITWNLYDGTTLVDSETKADCEKDREYTTTITVPYGYLIEGTKTVTATNENQIITLNRVADPAFPFQYADSKENIQHWYALNIHHNNKHYVYYSADATPNVQANVTTYQTAPEYAWGFVGNPADGFVIYNKASDTALYSADNNTSCTVGATASTFKATLTGWTAAQADGGFCLNVEGQQYVNFQGEQLKHWSDNDSGSTFHAIELDMSVDAAYKAAKVAALQALTGAANMPIYAATDIATANSAIDGITYEMNETSVAEAIAKLDGIMDTFYATADGKKFALVSKNDWSTRGVTRYLTAADNTTDRLTAAENIELFSVFTATYDATQNAYTVATAYMSNICLPVTGNASSEIYASETPGFYTFVGGASATDPATISCISSTVSNSQGGIHLNDGKNIVVWGPDGAASKWAFELVSDTDYEELVEAYETSVDWDGLEEIITTANSYPVGHGLNQYSWIEDGEDYTEFWPAIIEMAEDLLETRAGEAADVQEMIDYVTSYISELQLNMPKAGTFLRIKGNNTNKYITGNGTSGRVQLSENEDATTILYLDESNHLIGYGNGRGFNSTHSVAEVGSFETHTFAESPYKKGCYLIKSNYSGSQVLCDGTPSSAQIDRWGTENDIRSAWTLEEVTELPVTVTSAGYATLYAPVNLTIPADVKVYTLAEGEGSALTTTQIEDIIPANTGVVLENEGTFSFTITDETVNHASCITGTCATIASTEADGNYVFSIVDSTPGFYKFVGSELKGFKAYYKPTVASINGFSLDFGGQTVGVNSVISATNLKAGYDIQGRRINKIQKGINVINGKKIIK